MNRYQTAWVLVLLVLMVTVVGSGTGPAVADTVDEFPDATPAHVLEFPRAHVAHPDYRTEWWYFTGLVGEQDSERRYGYQLTVFRNRTRPGGGDVDHPWATNQVYLAHLALSDLEQREHHHAYRLIRGHPGLASADTTVPGGARVGDWNVRWGDPWTIRAETKEFGVDLTLIPHGPPLLHGEDGYSRKGPEPGQASYYYSYPRMETEGQLKAGEGYREVKGWTWFDHEVFSSQLASNQVGWDWFGLRLDDGSDLMMFRLREEDGSVSPTSGGTLRDPDGTVTTFLMEEEHFQPTRFWRSNRTGARYPVEWEIDIEDLGLSLRVEAAFEDQEMAFESPVSPNYWEGVVDVSGEFGGDNVSGEGYMELTGYDRPIGGSLVGAEPD